MRKATNLFWHNINVQEFIRYLDELLKEIEERFTFTKTENIAYKLFYEFQQDHLQKFSDESYQVFQCSDDSPIYSTNVLTPDWGSSIVTTPDPKKVHCSFTPASPESNCTSLSEMDFPPAFYSIGGATVKTARSLAGGGQHMQDYIEGCNVDLKAVNGIVETISA